MATKGYNVVRGFAARTKDGAVIDVTRERADELADLLPASVLKQHVEAGNLSEYDASDTNPTAAALAEPAPVEGDGFVRPTTTTKRGK